MHAVHVSRSAFRGWLCGMVTGGALVLAGSLGLGLPNRSAAVEPPPTMSAPVGATQTSTSLTGNPGPAPQGTQQCDASSDSIVEVWACQTPPAMSAPVGPTQTSTSSTGNLGLDPQGTQQCDPATTQTGPGQRDTEAAGSMLFETCRMVGPGGTDSPK
jgi:hypothetical protein